MTFNLIGLGLHTNSISVEAKKIVETSDSVYLEGYTVNFPYKIEELEKSLNKKIAVLNREEVEKETMLKDAKKKEISLLVYGDSLSATTHTQLILSCINQEIPYNIFHNASIITAIAETGLQLYKFGKTSSMPKWQKNYNPTSFLHYYKDNQKVDAHTLLLTDIDLNFKDAIDQLNKGCEIEGCEIDKVIVISNAGLKDQKIYFDSLGNLKHKNLDIHMPFCLIIPSNLHFHEDEMIKKVSEKI